MTTAGPADGGSNPKGLKEKLKNPFNSMREKFRDSSLYDVKVGLIHKKHEIGKFANLVGSPYRKLEIISANQI